MRFVTQPRRLNTAIVAKIERDDGVVIGHIYDDGTNVSAQNRYRYSLFGDQEGYGQSVNSAFAAARQRWDHRQQLDEADTVDQTRLKAALDTITSSIMDVYQEFRTVSGNLEAERHRDVRRPADATSAKQRYDFLCNLIGRAGIDYRGHYVYKTVGGVFTAINHPEVYEDMLDMLAAIDRWEDGRTNSD